MDFSKIKIEWEIGDEYDDAGDGHTFFHEAEGFDEDGNEYKATAIMIDGELDEIEEIERV